MDYPLEAFGAGHILGLNGLTAPTASRFGQHQSFPKLVLLLGWPILWSACLLRLMVPIAFRHSPISYTLSFALGFVVGALGLKKASRLHGLLPSPQSSGILGFSGPDWFFAWNIANLDSRISTYKDSGSRI